MMLKHIPIGYSVYNVELNEGQRTTRQCAGAILNWFPWKNYAQVQMASGEIRW